MDGRLLYNPLAVIRPRAGLFAALLIVIALTVVAWWGGIHLDGALDIHITPDRPSAVAVILESAIAWLSVAFLLFLSARIFSGAGGLASYAAVTGLSRFPYILSALVFSRQLLGNAVLAAFTVGENEVTVRPQELFTPALALASVAVVGLIVWAIFILYLGYKQVSGLRGGRAGLSFLIGLLIAELVSKILLLWLLPNPS